MDGKIVFRILAVLVMLAAVAGVAFFAFNVGVATHVQVPAATGAQVPAPYFYGWWPMSPFFGFGCFGPLIALFLLFLAIRAFTFVLFGSRWGHWSERRAWRHGWMNENGLPPMFKEWHDRAHGQPSNPNQSNNA